MGHGIKASVTVTAAVEDGVAEIDLGTLRHTSFRAFLNVTTGTGETPTLNVDVQDTVDNTNYGTLVSFTEATGEVQEFKTHATPFGDKLRISYAITGTTPVFTFTITIVAKD